MSHLYSIRPRLRFVTDLSTAGSTALPIYKTKAEAAALFGNNPRSFDRWIGEGFITGYRAPNGDVLVNLREVEAGFRAGKMRDPRKKYGSKARIVPLPVRPEVVRESGDAL